MEVLVIARGSGPAMRVAVDRLGRYRTRRAGAARAMHAAGHPDHAIARALGICRHRVPGLRQEAWPTANQEARTAEGRTGNAGNLWSPDQLALFADPNPEPTHV